MRVIRILHVEDNYGDANLLREAFSELGDWVSVEIAANGVIAIGYLRRLGERGGELPELILSDINMPQMDGFSLLQQLMASPQWKHIPVIMLTSSGRLSDRVNARRLGAVGYVVKPAAYDGYLALARLLLRFPDVDLKAMWVSS